MSHYHNVCVTFIKNQFTHSKNSANPWQELYYTYDCSISEDGANWVPLCENWIARCNDTIVVMREARYIKMRGTNNKNPFFHIIAFNLD